MNEVAVSPDHPKSANQHLKVSANSFSFPKLFLETCWVPTYHLGCISETCRQEWISESEYRKIVLLLLFSSGRMKDPPPTCLVTTTTTTTTPLVGFFKWRNHRMDGKGKWGWCLERGVKNESHRCCESSSTCHLSVVSRISYLFLFPNSIIDAISPCVPGIDRV